MYLSSVTVKRALSRLRNDPPANIQLLDSLQLKRLLNTISLLLFKFAYLFNILPRGQIREVFEKFECFYLFSNKPVAELFGRGIYKDRFFGAITRST